MKKKKKDPNSYAPDSEAKSDQAKYLFNCAQRAVRSSPSPISTLDGVRAREN